MIDFIEQAKKEGYSDDEIISHLSKQKKYAPFLKSAKNEGYSSKEILGHFSEKEKDKNYRKSIGHITPEERAEMEAPYGIASTVAQHPKESLASIPASSMGIIESLQSLSDIPQAALRAAGGQPIIQTPLKEKIEDVSGISQLSEEHKEELDLMNSILQTLGLTPEMAALSPKILGGVKNIVSKIRGTKPPPPPPGIPPSGPSRSEIFKTTEEKGKESLLPKAEILAEEAIGIPKKSQYEIAEEYLKGAGEQAEKTSPLKKITKPPLGLRVQVIPPGTRVRSLQGRVNTAGSSITPLEFRSGASGGIGIERRIKDGAARTRNSVGDAYRAAEQEYSGVESIFPQSASAIENTINLLRRSPRPSNAEIALANQLEEILNSISQGGGYISAPIQNMIAQSNSLTSTRNYDIPFQGVKDHLTRIARIIDEEAIEAVERTGRDSSLMRQANRQFAQWADRYQNDYVAPFLERRIRDPEKLFQKTVSDEGVYRAVSEALRGTPEGNQYVDALSREIAEKKLKPFIKSGNIGTPEYERAIRELEDLIGLERTQRFDEALRNQSRVPLPPSQQIKEAKMIEKASEKLKTSPEDVLSKLNSRTGIKELKEKMPPHLFDQLSKQKLRSILQEGKVSVKFTGEDLANVMNKEKNYEIIKEILGEKESQSLFMIAHELKEKELTEKSLRSAISKLTKQGIRIAGYAKLYKMLVPILSII